MKSHTRTAVTVTIFTVLTYSVGCRKPEPIVTGAAAETERLVPERAPNIHDTSQPVNGTNRGDVIEGRHIPPAAPRLKEESSGADFPGIDPAIAR